MKAKLRYIDNEKACCKMHRDVYKRQDNNSEMDIGN